MKTKAILILAAVIASVSAGAALAQTDIPIDRIGGPNVEILTASARDSAEGLRISGLVRRGRGVGRPPQAAHLDVSAFDTAGRRMLTTPTRLAMLTMGRGHPEPARFEASLPLYRLASIGRLEVRYQAKPHAAEAGEASQ